MPGRNHSQAAGSPKATLKACFLYAGLLTKHSKDPQLACMGCVGINSCAKQLMAPSQIEECLTDAYSSIIYSTPCLHVQCEHQQQTNMARHNSLPACVVWASTAVHSSSRPPACTISALMLSLLASWRSREHADLTTAALPGPDDNTCTKKQMLTLLQGPNKQFIQLQCPFDPIFGALPISDDKICIEIVDHALTQQCVSCRKQADFTAAALLSPDNSTCTKITWWTSCIA